MINLLVDEAYAFDYLSILEIKKEKNCENINSWLTCYSHLMAQFDEEKWINMIYSQEYRSLLKANALTFDAVDKAKTNQVSAKYVDDCNYQRYLAKQNFQNKFFKSNLSEIKIGYL
jgi:predicted transcriptional regulator